MPRPRIKGFQNYFAGKYYRFVSFYSWGYHYGMDNDYLQYVKTHMKPDGKCFLTVKEKNDLNFSIAITNEGLIYEKVHKFEAAHLVKITHK